MKSIALHIILLLLSISSYGQKGFTNGNNPFYTSTDTVGIIAGMVSGAQEGNPGSGYNTGDIVNIVGGTSPSSVIIGGTRSCYGNGAQANVFLSGGAVYSVQTTNPAADGVNFNVGDYVNIGNVVTANQAVVRVTSITATGGFGAGTVIYGGSGITATTALTVWPIIGAVTSYAITTPGAGYTNSVTCTTTAQSGHGTGLTLQVSTYSAGTNYDTFYLSVKPYRNSLGFQVNYTGYGGNYSGYVIAQTSTDGINYTAGTSYSINSLAGNTQALPIMFSPSGNQQYSYRFIMNVPGSGPRIIWNMYDLTR